MTTYNEVKNYKTTEFYNISPTHYFSLYDMRLGKHCLCFKVTDSSYLNMATHEYIELKSDDFDDLDMVVELVDAKVDWHYVDEETL